VWFKPSVETLADPMLFLSHVMTYCFLDVAVPYIAGTCDEHRFRVVHGRAHVFGATLGGEYAVDGHKIVSDAMDAEHFSDDRGKKAMGAAWVPIPDVIAARLRLDLEADSPSEL